MVRSRFFSSTPSARTASSDTASATGVVADADAAGGAGASVGAGCGALAQPVSNRVPRALVAHARWARDFLGLMRFREEKGTGDAAGPEWSSSIRAGRKNTRASALFLRLRPPGPRASPWKQLFQAPPPSRRRGHERPPGASGAQRWPMTGAG